jgi:ferrous iron transport protein B
VAGLLLARDDGAEKLVSSVLDRDRRDAVARLVEGAIDARTIPPEVALTEALHQVAGKLADQITSRSGSRGQLFDAIGRLTHHPVIGLGIAAVVVTAMYAWVGALGATLVVDWLSANVFEGWLTPGAERLAAHLPWTVARDVLVDPDFGLIPTGLFLAFGLVMPVLFFFYFAFNILTASGYLPRLSVLLDRILRMVGLNGKGILPLAMAFSCITMALITVRMLDTRKERVIASFLMLLGIPCAPLLAAMLVVLGRMPASASLLVFGFIAVQVLAAGALANKILRGRSSDFIMEIPPMRLPRVSRVLRQTVRQTYYFMKEAVPLFLIASFVLFVFDRVGGLDLLARISHPVVDGLLGLPDESVQVFIKTMIRREAGAAELEHVRGAFDNVQLVITLLVMTFLTPCINAIIVLVKERGLAMAAGLVVAVSFYALTVGAVLGGVLRLLGVTFT